jgi:hypothetical protein
MKIESLIHVTNRRFYEYLSEHMSYAKFQKKSVTVYNLGSFYIVSNAFYIINYWSITNIIAKRLKFITNKNN